jgi:hypothetical protein
VSDMSKWPPSKDGKFTQAWISLDKLPGSMMQTYSAERGHFTYGPIPAFTSCAITTSPDEAEVWRARGEPVLAIYTADALCGNDAEKVAEKKTPSA